MMQGAADEPVRAEFSAKGAKFGVAFLQNGVGHAAGAAKGR